MKANAKKSGFCDNPLIRNYIVFFGGYLVRPNSIPTNKGLNNQLMRLREVSSILFLAFHVSYYYYISFCSEEESVGKMIESSEPKSHSLRAW